MKRTHNLIGVWISVCLAACASQAPPAAVPFPTPGPVGETARVYPLLRGWFEGQTVQYYDLGVNTPIDSDDPGRVRIEPVWMFVTGFGDDGMPIGLEGQDNLFDVIPGDAAYSDLWLVLTVTPSANYVPNSLTSAQALLDSGLPIEQQRMLVNCPIVPPGSSLADESKELKKAWVKDQPVVYFDFGPTSAIPGQVYIFVTGFDEAGQPRVVSGQQFVFDSTRSALGYSDFWRVRWVTVDSEYTANSIRSAADIDPEQVTDSALIVNYPHQ